LPLLGLLQNSGESRSQTTICTPKLVGAVMRTITVVRFEFLFRIRFGSQVLRRLGASASQASMNMWASANHPRGRVALEQCGVRGHKVGTSRFRYTAGHVHRLVIRMRMPRCRPSKEVQKQLVYVACIPIRRRFEGVVVRSQTHIYEGKGLKTWLVCHATDESSNQTVDARYQWQFQWLVLGLVSKLMDP